MRPEKWFTWSPEERNMTMPEGKMVSREDRKYLALLNSIKGDSIAQKKINYLETKILEDLRAYNKKYEEEFPVFSSRKKL